MVDAPDEVQASAAMTALTSGGAGLLAQDRRSANPRATFLSAPAGSSPSVLGSSGIRSLRGGGRDRSVTVTVTVTVTAGPASPTPIDTCGRPRCGGGLPREQEQRWAHRPLGVQALRDTQGRSR